MRKLVRTTLLFLLVVLSTGTVFALDQDAQKAPPKGRVSVLIEPEFTINPVKTAVLIMDYENDILGMVPEDARTALVEKAGTILKEARRAKLTVIYVAVRFRKGYPEVNLHNKLFSSLKESGHFLEGTPGAEIDSRVAPQPGDIVVAKRRVGAFFYDRPRNDPAIQ